MRRSVIRFAFALAALVMISAPKAASAKENCAAFLSTAYVENTLYNSCNVLQGPDCAHCLYHCSEPWRDTITISQCQS